MGGLSGKTMLSRHTYLSIGKVPHVIIVHVFSHPSNKVPYVQDSTDTEDMYHQLKRKTKCNCAALEFVSSKKFRNLQ